MAASKIASGAGLRHVRAYTLDTTGYPDGDQSGSNGYGGIRVQGVKTFQANIPDVVQVQHTGDDRVFAQDSLPPTQLETATVTTGKSNQILDSALNGRDPRALGDGWMDAFGTNNQGFEEQVMVVGWRQALNTDDDDSNFGARQYITHIYPSTRMVPKGAPMSEGATDENSYNLTPTVVHKAPWGEDFDQDDHGYETAIKLRLITDNPIMVERYTGNGSITTFNTEFTPISSAKTKVYVDGVAATVNSVSTVNKTFTLSAAPTNNCKVVAIYECSDIA